MMKTIDCTQFIGKTVDVVIDRPMGSSHPRYGYTYSVNYGYVPGVIADDGDELDVYVLGVDHPVQAFRGECIAVIERRNDSDDKLIVVPDGYIMDDETIRQLTHFQEQYFDSHIVRKR
jgi:inorganic pyrophosphatase